MEVEITILKFESVSKRREIKRPTWFALDNDVLSHPDFFKLTGDEFRCWIWILSIASKMNKPDIRLNSEIFAYQCRSKESVFLSTIEKLKGKRIHDQTSPPQDQISPIHYTTDTTDTTDITDTTLQNTTDIYTTTAKKNSPSTLVSKAAQRGCIAEFSDDQITTKYFSKCTEAAQLSWIDAYPSVEFIKQECKKANVWITSNPQKAPKNFQRFFANWLSKGFENYRKGLPSRRLTNSEANAQALNELYQKVDKEEKDVTDRN